MDPALRQPSKTLTNKDPLCRHFSKKPKIEGLIAKGTRVKKMMTTLSRCDPEMNTRGSEMLTRVSRGAPGMIITVSRGASVLMIRVPKGAPEMIRVAQAG